MSNSLDSNRRSNQELLGGGSLASEFVSARSSLRSLRRFLVLCCISLSVTCESISVWEASPLWNEWAPRSSLGLLFTGIIVLSVACKSTSTTSCQDLNGLEFGEEGVGCAVQHAGLSVITAVCLHCGAHIILYWVSATFRARDFTPTDDCQKPASIKIERQINVHCSRLLTKSVLELWTFNLFLRNGKT